MSDEHPRPAEAESKKKLIVPRRSWLIYAIVVFANALWITLVYAILVDWVYSTNRVITVLAILFLIAAPMATLAYGLRGTTMRWGCLFLSVYLPILFVYMILLTFKSGFVQFRTVQEIRLDPYVVIAETTTTPVDENTDDPVYSGVRVWQETRWFPGFVVRRRLYENPRAAEPSLVRIDDTRVELTMRSYHAAMGLGDEQRLILKKRPYLLF